MRFKLQYLMILVAAVLFVAASFEVYGKESSVLLEAVATITLEKEPLCIAVNEETNRVYIGVDRGIMVLNGETDEVLEEIPIEPPLADMVYPIDDIAINPRTNRIFVPKGSSVSVIDGETKQEVGDMPAYGSHVSLSTVYSYGFAVNPVTNLVYIADKTIYKDRFDRVVVFDGETSKLVTSINIPGSNEHLYMEDVGVAVNPKTNRVYVLWSRNEEVYVIDGNTHEIIRSSENCFFMPTGYNMVDTLINPYTNYIYFISREPYQSMRDGETLESVWVDYQGDLRAINTQDNLLYTTESEKLYVLNGTTHETLASLELGWSVRMHDVAVNSKTGKVYLGHRSGKEISVVQGTLTFSEEREPPSEWTLEIYGVYIVLVIAAATVALFTWRRRRKVKS